MIDNRQAFRIVSHRRNDATVKTAHVFRAASYAVARTALLTACERGLVDVCATCALIIPTTESE